MEHKHPVFRSLTDPLLFLKVPYQFFILSCIVGVVSVVILNFRVMAIGLMLALHIIGVVMTRKDPRWFEIVRLRFLRNELDFSQKGRRYLA